MPATKEVEIDGEKYYVRKFSTKEFFSVGFGKGDQLGEIVGSISIGIGNPDGSRLFPSGDRKPYTEAAREQIEAIPFEVTKKLIDEITKFNGIAKESTEKN